MLDYGNPSMKSQIKQVAAVEGDLFFFLGYSVLFVTTVAVSVACL